MSYIAGVCFSSRKKRSKGFFPSFERTKCRKRCLLLVFFRSLSRTDAHSPAITRTQPAPGASGVSRQNKSRFPPRSADHRMRSHAPPVPFVAAGSLRFFHHIITYANPIIALCEFGFFARTVTFLRRANKKRSASFCDSIQSEIWFDKSAG